MTQAERDHLATLKKAKKRLIIQKQAAEELGIAERRVRRVRRALKRRGGQAVVQAPHGLPSNRKVDMESQKEATAFLSRPVYRGFGPSLASEYLANMHEIELSRETARQWMIEARLWRAPQRHVEKVHEWRPRRSRFGELAQWDTSEHDFKPRRKPNEASPERKRTVLSCRSRGSAGPCGNSERRSEDVTLEHLRRGAQTGR
jgi:hypothetical protein